MQQTNLKMFSVSLFIKIGLVRTLMSTITKTWLFAQSCLSNTFLNVNFPQHIASSCLMNYLLVLRLVHVDLTIAVSVLFFFFSIFIVLSLFLCRLCAVFTPVRSSAVRVTWWLWCSMAQSRAKIPGTPSSMSMFTTAWMNQVKLGLSTQLLTHFYKKNTPQNVFYIIK